MNTLISISDLIHESWSFFRNDWKTITKRNAWLLPVMVVYFALYIGGSAKGVLWLAGLGMLILLVGSIFVTLHATRYVLAKDGGTNQATKDKTLSSMFWPVLLICIISGLGAMGGMILFILPGIWFAIATGFAICAYIEEGKTGTSSLGRSMELVKGRWWKTLWRIVIPSFVFQIVLGIISLAALAVPVLFAAIGGAGAMLSMTGQGSSAMGAASVPILIFAGLLFIAAIVVNFLLSLVANGLAQVVQVKLYHSLKASR